MMLASRKDNCVRYLHSLNIMELISLIEFTALGLLGIGNLIFVSVIAVRHRFPRALTNRASW